MKAKKKIRKKRSSRLKGKPVPADSLSIGEELEPEDTIFGAEKDIDNDIIDIDEMEDFNYPPDDTDESEW
jgi:hypothetical protein